MAVLAPKARTHLIADIERDGHAHQRYLAEDSRLGHWMGEDGGG